MTSTYAISLEIKRDSWNWYDSAKSSKVLLRSYENMLYGSGRQTFLALQNCPSLKEAEKILLPFLVALYQEQNYYQDNLNSLNAHLQKHFLSACRVLEKLTGQPLYFSHYPIYLTTFPRLPYSEKKGHFFFSAGDTPEHLIAVFLHEGLHLQFHHYTANLPELLNAQLSEKAWHGLKESLTVVLDESLYPLLSEPDAGYPEHQPFRKVLKEHWQQNHDFNSLVKYALVRLPEFESFFQ